MIVSRKAPTIDIVVSKINRMKVLLANPATRVEIDERHERYFIKAGSRWPWSCIKKKNRKNTNCFFPFFLAYTANILRNAGYEVWVIDGVAIDMQESEFICNVQKINPDLIVIETATHAINYDLALSNKLKRILPQVKIMLSGAHATVFAHDLLSMNDCVDFVALGEYEFTVLELVRRLKDKSRDFLIDGLGCRVDGKVWVSGKKGFIDDINSLPYPAFDLFPSNDSPDLTIYRDGVCTYWPAVTLHSSRGCPFRCDFCLWNQVMYGNGPYRMFSPDRAVDEMEYVIKHYGAREIHFDDDAFCINKQHVTDICNEIKRRQVNVKWSCMAGAIVCDEEMIKVMADSGCIFMKFGVESGNREILKNIGKPLNPEKAIKVADWCRKYGIMAHATFSFGLDGETNDTMRETLCLANEIKFDTAQVSITTPLPGTRYYQKLVERGFLRERKWDSFDGTSTCVFDTDCFTAEYVQSFRKKAIKSMVLHKVIDPVWFCRFLKRNYLLYINYGIKSVLEPIKALMNL